MQAYSGELTTLGSSGIYGVTYGFDERPTNSHGWTRLTFSLEASLGIARTGDSQFSGATLDGVQGDLARSATLGRLQAGVLLRFGKTFKPTLRLGVGAQLAGIDSGLTPNAGGAAMESSSTEVGAFLAVSGGVDVWLGDAVLLGLGLGVDWSTQDNRQFESTASIGLHLGFAWEPSSNQDL